MLLKTLLARITAGQDQVAFCSSTLQITYAELHQNAIWIAQALQARGMRDGAVVAICMERSPSLIVAMMGVMLAGAAFTVVETHAQDELSGTHDAVRETLLRIKPDMVLVERGHSVWCQSEWPYQIIPAREYAWFSPLALPTGGAQSPAYVVFTSGTTGLCKGVLISHASLAHYCESMVASLGLPDGLRYGLVSTLSADLGYTSLFLALWTGGSVYLADDNERHDPACLAASLASHQVEVLKCTPTQWRLLCAGGGADIALKWLILGGERLPTQLARDTLATRQVQKLVNHYGPTEFTIGATIQPVTDELLAASDAEWVAIGQSAVVVAGADSGGDGAYPRL